MSAHSAPIATSHTGPRTRTPRRSLPNIHRAPTPAATPATIPAAMPTAIPIVVPVAIPATAHPGNTPIATSSAIPATAPVTITTTVSTTVPTADPVAASTAHPMRPSHAPVPCSVPAADAATRTGEPHRHMCRLRGSMLSSGDGRVRSIGGLGMGRRDGDNRVRGNTVRRSTVDAV